MLSQARRLLARRVNLPTGRRAFQSTPKRKNMMEQLMQGDSGKGILSTKMYHYTVYASTALFPVALALSPSKLNMPVDIVLGIVFPMHAHIGMNYIISDYCPKTLRGTARAAWLGVTVVTIFGLLKLNIMGDGMTESVKAMWRDRSPAEARAEAAAAKTVVAEESE
jgi:succinate dehydrogenase (ubiquinone) membrane anchor subunit